MHREPSPHLVASDRRTLVLSAGKRANHGFSLVEISLALGIIAFAFIALLGLLPVGLQTFRQAIDTGNEARIMQSFMTKLEATEFSRIKDLDFAQSDEIFYFDEEGMPTDTSRDEVPTLASQRLYAAKMFIEDPEVPSTSGTFTFGVNAVVVFANIASPAMHEFETLNSLSDLQNRLNKMGASGSGGGNGTGGSNREQGIDDLTIRTLLVAKMDGVSL
jgi:uncharacterized protein (TIGR02598 family)